MPAGTSTTEPADLKNLIREDASITPLRKLVVLELLEVEMHKRQAAASTQPTTVPAN